MTTIPPSRRWLRPAMTSSRLHLFDADADGNLTSGTALCRKSWSVSLLAVLTEPGPLCALPHCTNCEEKVRRETTGEMTTQQKTMQAMMRALKTGRAARGLPWVERLERR